MIAIRNVSPELRAAAPRLNTFRDCFEASMDFETALGCAGLADLPAATIEVLRNSWIRWTVQFDF